MWITRLLLLYHEMVSATILRSEASYSFVVIGMVFMSSSALDWRPILKGWLNTLPQAQSSFLWDMFDSCFQVYKLIRETKTYLKIFKFHIFRMYIIL